MGNEEVKCRHCGVNPVPTYKVKKHDYVCVKCHVKRYGTGHERQKKARSLILDHYGRVCRYCGETNDLHIDHVDGGGKAERLLLNDVRGQHGAVYAKIIREGFPACYQVLCRQCNIAKQDLKEEAFKTWVRKINEFFRLEN